jgi:DNA replication protein DnaC
MDKKQIVKQYCQQFKLGGITHALDQLIMQAETNATGYLDYTVSLLGSEATHREQNDVKKRLKAAHLPRSSDLAQYDYSIDNGLSKNRLNQLRELNWLDQVYNIILMGPSGTGKTFLAAGLCADAVQKGYKAYFRTMEELINMLKMKDFTRSAMADYKRLSKASLIVIDDIMLFPVEKNQAVSLFNFINNLYEKTSFIITTNKKPTEWATMLNDEILATALLDRLLYQCEIINLSGKSYRLKNRKTIFEPMET